MTQVAESIDDVWSIDPRHRGYEEDYAKSLVAEITDALRSSHVDQQSIIYNDRGTIESALRDALESCSYQEEGVILSFNDDYNQRRPSKRHLEEYVYLSTFPVQWDELELDQEINSIEEEIARLEEQKMQLKRSSSFSSSDNSGSESSSDNSVSQSNSSADEAEHSEEEYNFVRPISTRYTQEEIQQKNLKRRSSERSKIKEERKTLKAKKVQKKTVSSNCKTISHSDPLTDKQTEDQITPTTTNSPDSSCSSPASSPIKRSKSVHVEKVEVFKVEQILKLKSVLQTENNNEEDEDVDILN